MANQGLNLLNLENKTRQQPKIAHEQGAGSQCTKCGPKCSGFDLHYWRKICRNCRCNKENHLVTEDEDPTSRIVRLLDSPFPKTDVTNESSQLKKPTRLNFEGAVLALDGGPSSPLDWVPPAADTHLAVKYIEQLPPAKQPITGSQGAVDRKRALDRQLPSHDLDPEHCQSLSANEKRMMEEYVKNVRQFVVGQGLIQECPPRGKLPPPPPNLDRILGEKVSHISLTDPVKMSSRPVAQFITAKPFVKSTEPVNQKTHNEFDADLPPPPPEMLLDIQDVPLPPPLPELLIEPDNSIVQSSSNKPHDPVKDFFDFLDEQEGKKLPGKLKSPFLHQAAASGNFNAAAKPFGTGSPNLNQRQGTGTSGSSGSSPRLGARDANHNPPPVGLGSKPSNGSSPKIGYRGSDRTTGLVESDRASPKVGRHDATVSKGNQAPRRLLTTDFDYVPEVTSTKPVDNQNNNPVPQNKNNNQSPVTNRHATAQSSVIPSPPIVVPVQQNKTELPQDKKITTTQIPAAQQQPNYQQEVIQDPDQCWSCRKCNQPIQAGTVAIFAERAGSDKCWHPECFQCSICHEMLADLIYFFVDDQMFCGRHYAEQMKIPRCKACDELIFAAEYTSAEGANWHMDHFCCWMCDTPLAGHQYTPIEGQPHCLDCYQKKYGKDCYECGRQIRAEELRVSHDEMHWHGTASCFKCRQCQTPMMNRQFVLKNGQIYCSRECVIQYGRCQAQPALV